MSAQLQVTGEAKIRDLQGPVVANSGVITALDGLPSQYVRGDGTLADIPSVTGGGASVSYYLNGSVNQGTFGGSTYYQLGENAITGVGTNFSTSTDGLLAQFITDIDVPDVTEIPSGNWNIEFYMGVSASSGALASFYVEIYKYDGTTFTLVGSNVTTPEFLTNTTTVDAYFTSVAMPFTVLAQTDRIAIRVYASVAGKTVTMYTEDNRLCQVVTTFSRGMLSLNSLTDQQQYLTVGTAGTDFNIVSAVDTHTFNIPSASATNRGLITTGTQTIAGSKTFIDPTLINNRILIQNGAGFIKGNAPNAFSLTQSNVFITSDLGDKNLVIQDIDTSFAKLQFQATGDYDYTFPALSGTLALTSDLSSYVPYSGATTSVNLGENTYIGGFVQANGTSVLSGTISLKQNGFVPAGTGSATIGSISAGKLNIYFGESGLKSVELQNDLLTASRTYDFPDLSGTLALLEGSQTFTGAKTFNNSVKNEYGTFIKENQSDAVPSGYKGLFATTNGLEVTNSNTSSAFLNFNNAGNYTYTFPALSGTIALLDGSQTFTGEKVFNNNALFNSVLSVNYGAWLQKGTPTATFSSAFTTLYSEVGAINAVFRDNTNQAKLQFQAASNYTYTFPASSGTVALSSDLDSYVTLATAQTISGVKTFSSRPYIDNGSSGMGLRFKMYGSSSFGLNGYMEIAPVNNSGIVAFAFGVSSTATKLAYISAAGLTDNTARTFTLPDANGTLALTSNLSAYLPLTGGTLTGALNGTSSTFTNSVTTPQVLLTVSDNYFSTNNALSGSSIGYTYLNGGTGGLVLRSSGTTNSSITLVNSGYIEFVAGASEKMRLTSDGSLLLGTLVDTGEKLQVNGTGKFTGALTGTSATFSGNVEISGSAYPQLNIIGNSSTSGGGIRMFGSTTQYAEIYGEYESSTNGQMFFRTRRGGTITTALTLASTGAATFSSSVTSTLSSGVFLNNSSGGTNATQIRVSNSGGDLRMGIESSTGNTIQIGTSAYAAVIGNQANNPLQFTTNGTLRMTINGSGNVGIGTSSPSTKLTVFGGYANFTDGTIDVYAGTDGAGGLFGTISNHYQRFVTNNTERMRITSSGNVLIGTTSAGTDFTRIACATSGANVIGLVSTDDSSGAGFVIFRNSATSFIGGISRVGTTNAVAYITTSDYRLKEDFKQIKGLELVNKIKVYDFKWKDNDARMDGVIAHELQEILPYAVNGEKDGKEMQGVDYSKIVPVLVKAIQEQQQQIEELKALIAAK